MSHHKKAQPPEPIEGTSCWLSRAERESVVCLAGCRGFLDVLSKNPSRRIAPHMWRLKMARTHIDYLLDAYMAGLDQDQKLLVNRFAATSELTIVSKGNPQYIKNPVVIDALELNEVLFSNDDCMMCGKGKADAKACKRRKLLLRLGVMPTVTNAQSCPFQILSED